MSKKLLKKIRNDQIRHFYKQNSDLTIKQLAKRFDLSYATTHKIVRDLVEPRVRFYSNKRNLKILDLWNRDLTQTLNTVGEKFGITRERVRQILSRYKEAKYQVRSIHERTPMIRRVRMSKIQPEIKRMIRLYATPTWYKYLDHARDHYGTVEYRYLKGVLQYCWQNDLLDPLFKFHYQPKVTPIRRKILELKKKGYGLDAIADRLNTTKVNVSINLRIAKMLTGEKFLPNSAHPNQLQSVTLDPSELKKRLDGIREGVKKGWSKKQMAKNLDVFKTEADVTNTLRIHWFTENQKYLKENGFGSHTIA